MPEAGAASRPILRDGAWRRPRRGRPTLAALFIIVLVASAALISVEVVGTGTGAGTDPELQFGLKHIMKDKEWLWFPVLASGFGALLWYRFKPPDMGNVIDVQTERELVEYLTNGEGKVVIIDFTSKNCPYCDMINPVYGQVSKKPKYKDNAIFLSCNVEKFQTVMMEAGVQATPTFVAYRNAKVLQRISGPPKDKLEKYFDHIILGPDSKKQKKKKSSNTHANRNAGNKPDAAANTEAPNLPAEAANPATEEALSKEENTPRNAEPSTEKEVSNGDTQAVAVEKSSGGGDEGLATDSLESSQPIQDSNQAYDKVSAEGESASIEVTPGELPEQGEPSTA